MSSRGLSDRTRLRARSLSGAVVLLVCGLALPGLAHEEFVEIGGDHIRVRTDQGPGLEEFTFSRANEENLVVKHDPRQDIPGILVRGEGSNPGRTPVIQLDSAGWTPVPGGYEYSGDGSRGGITNVRFVSGELAIEASGPNWGFHPSGPQDAVWVHFRIEQEQYCAAFSGQNATILANQSGYFEASNAAAPGGCPEQVCGNGQREIGEECDDGNLDETDSCSSSCTSLCTDVDFASTYEGIQNVIFDAETPYSCANAACHGLLKQGDLDLRTEISYESLLGADGNGAPASSSAVFKRVEPAEPELSWLYLKLLSRTDPALLDSLYPNLPIGTPMPSGNTPALTVDHLRALRLWIRGGAPEDGVVEGTAELLGTCLPEPTPLKVAVPKAPPRDASGDSTGIQFKQTPWPLPGVSETSQGENEICMATYYDLTQTDLVPDWARIPCPPEFLPGRSCAEDASPCETDADCSGDPEDTCDYRNLLNTGGECFVYHKQTLLQDSQSHHSILQIYRGAFGPEHASWGPWTYKVEPKAAEYDSKHGLPCDPLQIDPEQGYHPSCSGRVVPTLACAGFGPPDVTEFGIVAGGNLPQFLVSQEPFFEFELADGVYSVLPMKGIMSWNSHAFNLTSAETTMAQYLNMEFARKEDQLYQSEEIFHADWIFAQNVMPFEKQEVCATYTAPKGANIFQLTSHTHLRGNRFRIWAPPNEPCQPPCPDSACADATDTICFCENSGVCSHDQSYCSEQWDCNQGCDRRNGVCFADASVACERRTDCLLNECLTPTPPFCSGPREDEPFYFSTEYSDPLQLFFDPPLAMRSQSVADRTFLYCSQFDNGSAPGSPPVKQQSTSPEPPPVSIFGLGSEFIKVVVGDMLGGPCNDADLFCLGGPNQGMPCGGDDSLCGEGGVCDACPAHGGVTTEDEMFILIGGFFQETTTTTTTAPTTTTTAPTTTTTSPPKTAPPTTTTSTTLPRGSRIGVCHKGRKVLSLPSAAVPAHLGHGDTIGSCNGKASERGKKKRGKGR